VFGASFAELGLVAVLVGIVLLAPVAPRIGAAIGAALGARSSPRPADPAPPGEEPPG
jgi:hypothetical protein